MNVLYVSTVDVTGRSGECVYAQSVFRHLLLRAGGRAGAIWPAPREPGFLRDIRENSRFVEYLLPPKSGHSPWWHVKSQGRLWKAMKLAQNEICPDIVVSSFKASTVLPGEFAARYNIPYVMIVEGITSRNVRRLSGIPGTGRMVDLFARRSGRRAKRVFVAYHEIKDWLLSLDGTLKDKIRVFAGGVDPRLMRPMDREDAIRRVDNGLKSDDLVLGFVGSFKWYHSLMPLLEAFRVMHQRLPHMKLLLVGQGPEEAKVRTFAKDHLPAGRVIFTGFQPLERIPEYVGASDMMFAVTDPRSTSNPMKCFEALGCERPVMVRKTRELEFVEAKAFGIVIEGNGTDAIARALLEVPAFVSGWKAHAAAARKLILERHDWNFLVDEILEVAKGAGGAVGTVTEPCH